MMEINTEEKSMQQLLLRLIINALSLAAAIKLITGISFVGEWWKIIGIAAVFGLINALIKPVIQLFTFPLIILTLGLFTLVINATMLAITATLSGPLHLGLQISGFWPALWGALVISLVSMVLSWVTGMNRS
jgi:putative membrane protein